MVESSVRIRRLEQVVRYQFIVIGIDIRDILRVTAGQFKREILGLVHLVLPFQ